MKIWDYIKDKLFNRSKALPEPTGQTQTIAGKTTVPNTKKEAFDAAIKVDVDIKPNTLDFAIDQYVQKLFEKQDSGTLINSYYTLINIGAIENQNSGNNKQNQEQFLENLNNDVYGWKTNIDKQLNKDETNVNFYHVMNAEKDEEQTNYRIYLNCKKENVALLADKLARELEEQEYYFKFCADENNMERAEQFVFYIDDKEDLQRKISAIEKINRENPELFEGSYNVNPFMKTHKGYIAYTPEVKIGKYNNLSGNSINVSKSYNTLLSKAIEDACVVSIKQIAMSDLNFSEDSEVYSYKTVNELAGFGLLQYVYDEPNLRMKFVENVKKNLKLISERNPELDIKGIENKTRTQEKITENTITQQIPENY